jgi:serine/threonine-protein kinase
MGVVWKAHDGKLDRDVAVKILPAEFSEDKQRLGRFEREAKLLAALNHPNIASIYGLEETDGTHFLVLELIPGQSLAETLKAGPLPVEEALDVCRQVAEGLEAAHDAGVIHRDLKPGNVRVTPDGKAKVLDFGLAKELGGEGAGSVPGGSATDLSHSPTVAAGTQAGVILGTAPYMSPEQARGKKLDKRTDIWSFGCLLYECLTGRMAFTGETVPDIFSAILQGDPDWTALPERTPPRVRELMERCLEKSPRNRLRDIGDARIEIEKSLAGREWTTSGIRAAEANAGSGCLPGRAVALLAVAMLVLGAILGPTALTLWNPTPERSSPPTVSRVSINVPRDMVLEPLRPFRISPGGETILFWGSERASSVSGQTRRLYTRRLDSFGAVPVRGSEEVTEWAWSPDGRWLAMVVPVSPGSSRLQIVKVPADGSTPPVKIGDWPENMGLGLSWMPGGDLVAPTVKPYRLLRFPSDGSPPKPPVDVQAGDHGNSMFAVGQPLPDNRHVLTVADTEVRGRFQIDTLLLDVEDGSVRLLVEEAWGRRWLPSGHLVAARLDAILAVPFDVERLELRGGPVAILDGLRLCLGLLACEWSVAGNGTFLYVPAGESQGGQRIAYVTRDGDVEPWSQDEGLYYEVSVSRDGERVAVTTATEDGWNEIWISDVGRPRLRPLVTEPSMDCWSASWSPEGDRISYFCRGQGTAGGVYTRRWDGTDEPEMLLEQGAEGDKLLPTSFSPDGSTLLIERRTEGRNEILMLPLVPAPGGSREPRVLLPRESNPSAARFSADGRWIAYASDETGRREVYVRTIDPEGELGPEILVSTDGGTKPRLAPNREGATQELFYEQNRQLKVVSVSSAPALAVGDPTPLFDLSRVREQTPLSVFRESVAHLPDGRMLFIQAPEEAEIREINVVLNFDEEIKRKLAEAE